MTSRQKRFTWLASLFVFSVAVLGAPRVAYARMACTDYQGMNNYTSNYNSQFCDNNGASCTFTCGSDGYVSAVSCSCS